jgi:glutathione S-transferase
MWAKVGGHPCWRVQKALEDQGIDYELVKHPTAKWKRDEIRQISGQKKYPVIQFEDGSVYREESKQMAEKIRAGKLFEGRQASSASPS